VLFSNTSFFCTDVRLLSNVLTHTHAVLDTHIDKHMVLTHTCS
jgi:hypothetical protein